MVSPEQRLRESERHNATMRRLNEALVRENHIRVQRQVEQVSGSNILLLLLACLLALLGFNLDETGGRCGRRG